MKEKSIILVGENIENLKIYKEQLEEIFYENTKIDLMNPEDLKNDNLFGDVVLIFSKDIYQKSKKYFSERSYLMVPSRTISREAYLDLKSIEKNKKYFLADETIEMAAEIEIIINQLGIKDIQWEPTSIDSIKDKDINVVLLKDRNKEIHKNKYHIGYPLIDIDSILEIASSLNMDYIISDKNLKKSYRQIASPKKGLEDIFNKVNRTKTRLDNLFASIDEGYIEFDRKGNIENYNLKAYEILGEELKGNFSFDNFVEEKIYQKIFKDHILLRDEIIKIKDTNLIATFYPTLSSGNFYGTIITIKEFKEFEKREHEIRKKVIGKGHKAKYTFKNIIGESKEIKKSVKIAKRMANSESSVVIRGETGTGKELFAQAIHNESNRRGYAFVAVNCGALPNNILESELFGYEEGAFTGARKGGKAGLFELAHRGTIFLDEISEMPFELQSKLLRVLQEKEIMRLGSDRVIDVDIRVIAATNRNLEKLTKEDKFRRDLYYRLNVLPINLPSLKERKKDIEYLLDYFKNYYKGKYTINMEAREMLNNYKWSGNVRELQNFVEYFVNLGKVVIGVDDIPIVDLKGDKNKNIQKIKVKKLEGLNKNESFILEELYTKYVNNERIGRRKLKDISRDKNILISEGQIGDILKKLENESYVKIGKGRQGSFITEKGIELIKDD